jgi:hypothetical protein
VTFRQTSNTNGNVTLQAATLAIGQSASLSAAADDGPGGPEPLAADPPPLPIARQGRLGPTTAIGYDPPWFHAQ